MGRYRSLLSQKGDQRLAVNFAERAVKESEKRTEDPAIDLQADYMVVMAQIGNINAAVTCFEKFTDIAYDQFDMFLLLQWLEASAVMLSTVTSDSIVVHVQKPSWAREDHTYQVKELRDILDREAREIAQKIDKRNGNNYYSTRYNYYLK